STAPLEPERDCAHACPLAPAPPARVGTPVARCVFAGQHRRRDYPFLAHGRRASHPWQCLRAGGAPARRLAAQPDAQHPAANRACAARPARLPTRTDTMKPRLLPALGLALAL